MFGIKKKLSALIPTDARAHLQNALTVEWDDGNKTVLVDIPNGPSNDVELEGLNGRRRSNSGAAGYGRLADDDEDKYTRAYRGNTSRGQSSSSYGNSSGSGSGYNSSYASNQGYSNSTYPSYKSSSSSNQKNLPPLPPRGTGSQRSSNAFAAHTINTNPFEETDAEYPSPVPSTSTYASSGPGASPYARTDAQFGAHSHFGSDLGVPSGSIGSTGRKAPNPWATFRADEVDLLGDVDHRSRGADGAAQNPFR